MTLIEAFQIPLGGSILLERIENSFPLFIRSEALSDYYSEFQDLLPKGHVIFSSKERHCLDYSPGYPTSLEVIALEVSIMFIELLRSLHLHFIFLSVNVVSDTCVCDCVDCKMGETRAALQMLRKIEGKLINTNVVMHNTIIDSLCKDKLVLDAYGLYSEMIAKKIYPDVVTFSSLIYGFCIVGQFKDAFRLFHEMVLKNINRDVYTFNILVDALCKEGDVKVAKNLLAVMMKEGVIPDVVTYGSLMDGYCLVNEVNKAKHVFNIISQMGVAPDAHTYSIMINGFCKIKMVDEALSLFDEMRRRGIAPNTVTYNSLIDGLCKSGRIPYAWELVDTMHNNGQPADIFTYNSLIDALCKNHHIDQGIQPDMYTYNILIDGLCKGGRLKNAQDIFQDLLIKEGLFDEVDALMSKMDDNGIIPDAVTYVTIIRALFHKDENEQAEKLLREMIARGLL
ncbi:pentatricopeptide (PPR) repeat protein [Medicago truncatula]|uniref:Pentatricopeptide (PPR) repeat protein n=1 Tax=Medicago truncatula TaxID=3880 RepID=A0A072TKS4_MEDTR|nr:pentatricopeptide (PPR) repeat protein [Medicago truncatula]